MESLEDILIMVECLISDITNHAITKEQKIKDLKEIRDAIASRIPKGKLRRIERNL